MKRIAQRKLDIKNGKTNYYTPNMYSFKHYAQSSAAFKLCNNRPVIPTRDGVIIGPLIMNHYLTLPSSGEKQTNTTGVQQRGH